MGDNIKTAVENKAANWYKGPTMLDALDAITLQDRFPDGPLRVPILDKMRVDANLIVYGKVENGTMSIGEKLAIMPSGAPAQVLKIVDSRTESVRQAFPGDNIEIKINVADDNQIDRGFVLCHRTNMMPVTELFEAELDVLDLLDSKPIITPGYSCIMHMHTFSDEIEIKQITKVTETNEKGEKVENTKPKFARGNTKIMVRIAPRAPIAIEKLEVIPQMAKFTLRDEGKTICIGRVMKYKPYSKGVVTSKVAEATKQMNSVKIVDNSAGKELTFNMETGETSEKAAGLGAIAES